jgi:hypothetical protein
MNHSQRGRVRGASRGASRGQAAMDYIVGCALVTALLVAPLPGGRSAIDLLLDGMRLGYARLVTALAVPV